MRRLQLLGTPKVDRTPAAGPAEGSEPRFRSRRTVALLGYLAAERRPIGRDHLAALFWPDETLSGGRGKLRRELHNLARMLPDCWETDRHAVAFVPSADTAVDLYQVARLEAEERWGEAAEVLNGEFLEGIALDHNPEFEHWLLGERERWRERARWVLRRLIEGRRRRGQYTDALLHTHQLLQFAPWDEEAHRDAMRFLAWTGQRGAALRQFERCQAVLREELAVEPDPETAALHRQIEAGSLDLPPRLPAFLSAEKARHPYERPLFVGREKQLTRLDSFLEAALAGRGGVAFVTGDPGRGKSALLEAFAGRAMERHPELLVAVGKCSAYSGLGDPYIVVLNFDQDKVRQYMDEYGFDAHTRYGTPPVAQGREHAYSHLTTVGRWSWDAARVLGRPYVLPMSIGWDRRPRDRPGQQAAQQQSNERSVRRQVTDPPRPRPPHRPNEPVPQPFLSAWARAPRELNHACG